MNSILEITENEYLIKLNRQQFNLSFVRDLLRMASVFDPGGEEANSSKVKIKETDQPDDDDLEIPDRHISPDQNHNAEPDYFDSLDEK